MDIARFLKFFAILAVIGALATACTEQPDQSVGTDQQALTSNKDSLLGAYYHKAWPQKPIPEFTDQQVNDFNKMIVDSRGNVEPTPPITDSNGDVVEMGFCWTDKKTFVAGSDGQRISCCKIKSCCTIGFRSISCGEDSRDCREGDVTLLRNYCSGAFGDW